METCIFCRIGKGETEAKFEYQDDEIIAFADIKPKAPIHLLIVPRKHIKSVMMLGEVDKEILGQMIWTAKKIAAEKGLRGYKLVFNCGRLGGQVVDHLHLHLLGGWPARSCLAMAGGSKEQE